MILYSINDKGELIKLNKLEFTAYDTYLVDDETTVVDEINKFVLVCIAIDDVTGVIEVLLFEKSGILAEYGVAPDGKTLVVKLKEYETTAGALVEIGDFIS